MQKLVIDTNVFVSALIQRSYPYMIITELFIGGKVELCLSDEVLQEYYEVFYRKKFLKYPEFQSRVEYMIAIIDAKSARFNPKKKLNIISDKDDNKFLELAEASKANYLITGNSSDFTLKK